MGRSLGAGLRAFQGFARFEPARFDRIEAALDLAAAAHQAGDIVHGLEQGAVDRAAFGGEPYDFRFGTVSV